jgi:WD40 repeat protein
LAISNDGEWIAVGAGDNSIRIWRSDTLELVHTIATDLPIRAVTIAKVDEAYVLIAGSEAAPREDANRPVNGLMYAWRFDENGFEQTWKRPLLGYVVGITCHPDQSSFCVYSFYNRIESYRVDTGELEWRVRESGNPGNDVAWSNDGKKLASAGNHCIHWNVPKLLDERPGQNPDDIPTLEECNLFRSTNVGRYATAVVTDRQARRSFFLGAFSDDHGVSKSLGVADFETGTPQLIATDLLDATCLAVSPDDTSLVVGMADGTIRFFSIEEKKEMRSFKVDALNELRSLQFIDQGSKIVATNRNGACVLVIDIESGQAYKRIWPQ